MLRTQVYYLFLIAVSGRAIILVQLRAGDLNMAWHDNDVLGIWMLKRGKFLLERASNIGRATQPARENNMTLVPFISILYVKTACSHSPLPRSACYSAASLVALECKP